jgi:cobalt-zinc-cadmium efflux system outer membrane protein
MFKLKFEARPRGRRYGSRAREALVALAVAGSGLASSPMPANAAAPAEVKPAEVKPAEAKPAEVKPTEAKDAENTPTASLSLDEALRRAESASVLVRRARAERALVASRDVGASLLLPSNPVAAFAAGRRREVDVAGRAQGVQMAAHLEQTFEVAGQRGTRRAEVARQLDAAGWRETAARVETRARARAAYIGTLLADAQLAAARRRIDLVRQLVDGVRTRVQSGAASSVDLHLARVEQGRAIRDRAAAEQSRAMALAELRILVDLPPGTNITLTTVLGPPPARATAISPLLERAHAYRAELKEIAAARDATDAAITRLSREATPNPTLFVDYQRDLPGHTYLGGGVALPLPFWRRNQGELAVARSDRDRLGEESALARREVAAEVERAFRSASVQGELLHAIETEMLPAAESAVDLITQGWRAGKFDLFRVIQASREAAEARRDYLVAFGALWEATIALDRAVGTP